MTDLRSKPVATSEEVGTNEGGKKENDMADQWLYSRDGTDHGPVPSSTLVELAKNGELLPTDLLWKEGMAEWKPASSFPKLFPPQSSAEEVPVFVVNDKKPKAGNANDKTRVRQATSSLKAHAQTAGRLAKLTAEKTRITTVSLPLAYAELGKHRYETREDGQAFSATCEELDAITSAITANAKTTPASQATSFAEKAKKVASQGILLANSQKLALQQKALFARLGKEVYGQQGGQAGPESLVKAIEPLLGRLATLDKELAENVKKAGGKKRLWLIAGGVLCGLIILGGMFGEADSDGEQQGVSQSAGDDEDLKELAAKALMDCTVGISPEEVQAIFRATASRHPEKWGVFKRIRPSKTKGDKTPHDRNGFPFLLNWYGKETPVECQFRKNVLTGKWVFAGAYIGEQQYRLKAVANCQTWMFDLAPESGGYPCNAIVHAPLTGDPISDGNNEEVARKMMMWELRGNYRVVGRGVIPTR